MSIDALGNVGIGTTATNFDQYASLEIRGRGTTGGGLIRLSSFDNTVKSDYSVASGAAAGAYFGPNTAHPLVFVTGASEKMRIAADGSFLVGQATAGPLNSGSFSFASGTTSYGGFILINHSTTNVDGSGFAAFYRNAVNIGSIAQSGTTGVLYLTTSDYRLKDNIATLTGSGAFIDALTPRTWTWKEDGTTGVGFIAHEVAEVAPRTVVGTLDAVDEDGKDVNQQMSYSSPELIANMVAELKELRARVAALEA
jgi:hypothetical protein